MSDDVQEIWKEIPGWPEYQVSSHGKVRRVAPAFGARTMRELKLRRVKNGYIVVSLCRNARKQGILVHRAVAAAFIGPIPSGMDVCHNDGVRDNNKVSNLRIDTRKGNMADTVRHGTANRGQRCGSNKYSEDTIISFRADVDSGMKVCDAGRKHGLPYSYAYAVAKKVTWRWL